MRSQILSVYLQVQDRYSFECEGGPLKNCAEWRQLGDLLDRLPEHCDLSRQDLIDIGRDKFGDAYNGPGEHDSALSAAINAALDAAGVT